MIAFLLSLTLLTAQPAENMYQEYITPEVQSTLDRFDDAMEASKEAEKKAQSKKTRALLFSVLIGLIPLAYVGRMAVKGKTYKENPHGTAYGLVLALLGGLVLFGLNYGVFLLRIKMGDSFNIIFGYLLVAAMVVGIIYLLRKKG